MVGTMSKWDHLSPDDIIRERDENGLSWANVAKVLELGNPSTARAAYTALTGKPHTASTMPGRAAVTHRSGVKTAASMVKPRRNFAPGWDRDTDPQEIVNAVVGHTISVRRDVGRVKGPGSFVEEMDVEHVLSFTECNGSVVMKFAEPQPGIRNANWKDVPPAYVNASKTRVRSIEIEKIVRVK